MGEIRIVYRISQEPVRSMRVPSREEALNRAEADRNLLDALAAEHGDEEGARLFCKVGFPRPATTMLALFRGDDQIELFI